MIRESVLAHTLVELTDTLVDDFDVVDLLLLLAAPAGQLRAMASSSGAAYWWCSKSKPKKVLASTATAPLTPS